EGRTLGPVLADGSQSLLMISDNNFSPEQQTQLLLFRLQGL
ncbi:MAG: endonuclease/exonuclease/phosphatase, partial [Prochlorothrix sp.]